MKSLSLPGQLVLIIEQLTGIAVAGEPFEDGQLERLAEALKTWESSPTFAIDCKLDGLNTEQTRRNIHEICMCADSNEPVFL